MDYNDTYYLLLAAAFVCIANLMALAGLGVSYFNAKKGYILLACFAVVVEILRQIPDFLLVDHPDSYPVLLASSALQFVASAIFLAALLQLAGKPRRHGQALLGLFTLLFLSISAYEYLAEVAYTVATWYVSSIPVLLTTAALFWASWSIATPSSGRNLLLLSSLTLFVARAWLPATLESLDLLYLIYYMEVLMFPIMAMALNLTEVEATHGKVQALLKKQTQSEKDLQFILDNSLDITLIADNVGLLLSWNKRAEGVFGYDANQVVGKYHIDELFAGNYWHKNATEFNEFEALMENVDGGTFPVKARMRTVHKDDETYSIYVINEETEAKAQISAAK